MVVVFAPKQLWFVAWLVKWLSEDEPGQTDFEVVGGALMYLGILQVVFVFLGYTAKVTMDSINVTDITTLPIFGPIFSPIGNAMSIGATVILLIFLVMIIGALLSLMQQFKGGVTAFRQA